MYMSPIELIVSDIQMKTDEHIVKAVQRVGVNVDKEELIKALKYDRHQYEKGYADGSASVLQWIPCSERLPEPGEYYLVTRKIFGWNCTEYRKIDIAKYEYDGWHNKATKVLAWCELPKPWEGEEHGKD